jgi:hypothetical protein
MARKTTLRRCCGRGSVVAMNTLLLHILLVVAPTRTPPPDDIVLGPTDSAGACGVVEEAAGCETIALPWPDGSEPPVLICRCPWDWTPAPSPCAPGEGDCSE